MPSRSQRKRKARNNPIRLVDNQTVRLTKAKFNELKELPDFATAIRVGRVLNALTFAMQLVIREKEQKTAKGRRNARRAFLIFASYVKESLEVFYSMRSTYSSYEYYDEVQEILYPRDRRHEDILKLIRDSTGFHLDSSQKLTTDGLKSLGVLTHYDFLSGDGTTTGDFYLDMADLVDINYFIDQFKQEGQTDEDAFRDLV